ncbi:MAG TPA: DUF3089 domain-containing protein [Chitinophagaceae bacterium]|nr:DUF3089 domain-containing protein [Chitinophagaceae bacterium]
MRIIKRGCFSAIGFLFVLLNTVCAEAQGDSTLKGTPDYSSIENWAAHPWKHDPSDSLPAPLREAFKPDSSVDIFFIHPTTYINLSMPEGWNAPIDDADLNSKTDKSTILYQATVFNMAGRVFAPRYRQANLEAYYTTDTAAAQTALDEAYNDVKAAFQYYLAHYNNGRPIIIASHSQGTTHAKRLLREFFDGKPLQQQLVAAYIVGMPVEPGYFANIPPCNKPGETGCFCTWRTFKNGYLPGYVKKENFTAVVTNPLTWDTDKPEASRKDNDGSIFFNFNKIAKHAASANIHGGVLWTEKPHFFGNIFYFNRNYHIADYNLYYISIRNNVSERVNAYKKQHTAG